MASKFAIIALTQQGARTAVELAQLLHAQSNYQVTVFLAAKVQAQWPQTRSFGSGGMPKLLQQLFRQQDCVICIMATGIVVRILAPVIQDKTLDPAVIVLDEKAHHVISLLSGHVGRANQWTLEISSLLHSQAVITTATDTENVQALDVMAQKVHGWYPNFKANTKLINGLLANHEVVYLYIEPYLEPYFDNFNGLTRVESWEQIPDTAPLVILSDHINFPKRERVVHVIPQINVLGIGCRKNITYQMLQQAFTEFCDFYHLASLSFCAMASIDLKQSEPAIQYLSRQLGIPVTFYTATQLQHTHQQYPASSFVQRITGVGNVACAAADVKSRQAALTDKFVKNQVTLALGRKKIKEK